MNFDHSFGVILGVAIGVSMSAGLTRVLYARKLKARILKIAETNTISISDFAGKPVSLEKFCDRLFAPVMLVGDDEETRRHARRTRLIAILLALAMIAGVVSLFFFD